jgi:UDP-glucose:glycoprotein glucosyltransferase
MPFDHIYISRGIGGGKTVNISDAHLLPVVLYGPIGSSCAAELDDILSTVAENESRVVYAWRPVLPEACSISEINACGALGTKGTLTLHGYGVELAIKNMEYNARDDSKAAPEEEAGEKHDTTLEKNASTLEEEEEEEEEDGSSFQFKTLLERTPELRQELLTFRDHLLAAASQEQALKIKDVKDLGLQATQRIISASDPLHLLGEVAQNFPLMVETLSKGDVTDDLRTAAGMLSTKLPPQNQFLLVNGVPYETTDFNLYDFIDTLRQEVRLMDTLAAAGLPPTAAREVAILRGTPAAATSASGGEAIRLDLLPSAENNEIVWVNDLEKDQAYKGLPKALIGLLQPGFMGQAPAVRRNVFNVLLAIDPAAPHGLDAVLDVQTMVEQRWPVRLGIMPVASSVRDSDSDTANASGKAAMLFSAIAAVHGGPAAVEFLARCGSGIEATYMQLSAAEYAVKLLPVAEKTFEAFWKELAKWKFASSSSAASDDEYADDYEDDTTAAINPKQKSLAKIKPGDALQQALHATGDVGTAARKLLSTSTALIAHKGLTPTVTSGGAVVFNGVVSSVQEDGGWRGSIGSTWQSEMQRVAQDIYLGRLSDDSENLYQDILKLRGTLPRYNLRVMPSAPKSKRNFKLHAGNDELEGEAPRQVVLTGPDVGLEAISNLPVHYFLSDVAADSSSDDDDDGRTSGTSAFSDDYSDLDDDNEDGDEEQEESIGSTCASSPRLVTHWVVVDPTTPSGLQLASDALQHESSVSRIGILVNLRDDNNNSSSTDLSPVEELVVAVAAGIGQARKSASRADLIDLFAELALIKNVAELTFDQLTKQLPESLSALKGGAAALVEPIRSDITAAVEKYKLFLQRGLSIPPGQNAVVTNGRVVYVRFLGDVVKEDFELMDIGAIQHQFASKKTLGKILSRTASLSNCKNKDEDEEQQQNRQLSNIAVVVSSVLIAYQPDEVSINVRVLMNMIATERRNKSPLFISTTSLKSSSSTASSTSSSSSSSSPLLIQAIVNPLTKTTQQLSAIFTALRTSIDPDIHVRLNPVMEYSEMPLKTFYRFVVPIVDTHTPMERNLNSISALFATLPLHKTLTLGMDVPEGWLVEPVATAHDLDNLRLDELEPSDRYATAEFELEALMVYGMCIDEGAIAARDYDGVHPRGVQLQLGTNTNPALVDTLVMSNLGYFQMKAGPGVWSLRLAPGRSQDLYTLSGSSAADGGGKGGATGRNGISAAPTIVRPSSSSTIEKAVSVPVAVAGFGDSDVLLVLHKDPLRRHEDVLDADSGTVTNGNGAGPTSSSMWSKVTKAVRRDSSSNESASDDDTIHVFTVASGHMYERLQKIMILSAIKRTKNRVKFWFIKNYMSPTMKQFVPIMARQYEFDYE